MINDTDMLNIVAAGLFLYRKEAELCMNRTISCAR